MTVIDHLNQGNTFSLEVFPPKGTLTQVDVNRVLCGLSGIEPDWISVTCSAGGTGSTDNIGTAKFIKSTGYTPVTHLTCIGQTKESITRTLQKISETDIRDVMILRGDLPKDHSPQSDFKYASDLVAYVKSCFPSLCIGVAAYPEVHPESQRFSDDIEVLKKKQDEGAQYAVTQLFYYNETFYRLRDQAVRAGVAIPIIPGVMPVFSSKTIQRICSISNVTVDSSLFSVITRFDGDQEAIACAGLAYTTKQIVDLLSNGVSSIHFYTMNRPKLALQVFNNIKPLIRR